MGKTKICLVFDDGFVESTLATAELFESFGLRAAFAVLANPSGFAPRFEVGDFDLWNQLQSRGHFIQPHGYTHANLQIMSYSDAITELERCLQIFSEKLRGFDPRSAVYCFAYNASTPALCQWLIERIAAVRTGGDPLLSSSDLESRIWRSQTFGPEDPGTDLMDAIIRARREGPGVLLYVLHGLDGEAWGAISRDRLCRAIEVILEDPALEYAPLDNTIAAGS